MRVAPWLENKREAPIGNAAARMHHVDLGGNVMHSVAIIARWTAELLRGIPLNNSLQRRIKGVRGCFRNDHLPDLAQSLCFLRRIILRQNIAEQIWELPFVHESFSHAIHFQIFIYIYIIVFFLSFFKLKSRIELSYVDIKKGDFFWLRKTYVLDY